MGNCGSCHIHTVCRQKAVDADWSHDVTRCLLATAGETCNNTNTNSTRHGTTHPTDVKPLTVQVLLKAADFAGAAEADLCALVVGVDVNVQCRLAQAVAAAGTTGLRTDSQRGGKGQHSTRPGTSPHVVDAEVNAVAAQQQD